MVVHGADITTLGVTKDLDWLEQESGKSFELKKRGRIGIELDGDNDIRILKRVAMVTPEGLTYEADPRHFDVLLNSLGLTAANAVVIPGIQKSDTEPNAVKHNESEDLDSYTIPDTHENNAPMSAIASSGTQVSMQKHPSFQADTGHGTRDEHAIGSILKCGVSQQCGQLFVWVFPWQNYFSCDPALFRSVRNTSKYPCWH